MLGRASLLRRGVAVAEEMTSMQHGSAGTCNMAPSKSGLARRRLRDVKGVPWVCP